MSKKVKIKSKPGKAKIKLKSSEGELPISAGDLTALLGSTLASVHPPALAAPIASENSPTRFVEVESGTRELAHHVESSPETTDEG